MNGVGNRILFISIHVFITLITRSNCQSSALNEDKSKFLSSEEETELNTYCCLWASQGYCRRKPRFMSYNCGGRWCEAERCKEKGADHSLLPRIDATDLLRTDETPAPFSVHPEYLRNSVRKTKARDWASRKKDESTPKPESVTLLVNGLPALTMASNFDEIERKDDFCCKWAKGGLCVHSHYKLWMAENCEPECDSLNCRPEEKPESTESSESLSENSVPVQTVRLGEEVQKEFELIHPLEDYENQEPIRAEKYQIPARPAKRHETTEEASNLVGRVDQKSLIDRYLESFYESPAPTEEQLRGQNLPVNVLLSVNPPVRPASDEIDNQRPDHKPDPEIFDEQDNREKDGNFDFNFSLTDSQLQKLLAPHLKIESGAETSDDSEPENEAPSSFASLTPPDFQRSSGRQTPVTKDPEDPFEEDVYPPPNRLPNAPSAERKPLPSPRRPSTTQKSRKPTRRVSRPSGEAGVSAPGLKLAAPAPVKSPAIKRFNEKGHPLYLFEGEEFAAYEIPPPSPEEDSSVRSLTLVREPSPPEGSNDITAAESFNFEDFYDHFELDDSESLENSYWANPKVENSFSELPSQKGGEEYEEYDHIASPAHRTKNQDPTVDYITSYATDLSKQIIGETLNPPYNTITFIKAYSEDEDNQDELPEKSVRRRTSIPDVRHFQRPKPDRVQYSAPNVQTEIRSVNWKPDVRNGHIASQNSTSQTKPSTKNYRRPEVYGPPGSKAARKLKNDNRRQTTEATRERWVKIGEDWLSQGAQWAHNQVIASNEQIDQQLEQTQNYPILEPETPVSFTYRNGVTSFAQAQPVFVNQHGQPQVTVPPLITPQVTYPPYVQQIPYPSRYQISQQHPRQPNPNIQVQTQTQAPPVKIYSPEHFLNPKIAQSAPQQSYSLVPPPKTIPVEQQVYGQSSPSQSQNSARGQPSIEISINPIRTPGLIDISDTEKIIEYTNYFPNSQFKYAPVPSEASDRSSLPGLEVEIQTFGPPSRKPPSPSPTSTGGNNTQFVQVHTPIASPAQTPTFFTPQSFIQFPAQSNWVYPPTNNIAGALPGVFRAPQPLIAPRKPHFGQQFQFAALRPQQPIFPRGISASVATLTAQQPQRIPLLTQRKSGTALSGLPPLAPPGARTVDEYKRDFFVSPPSERLVSPPSSEPSIVYLQDSALSSDPQDYNRNIYQSYDIADNLLSKNKSSEVRKSSELPEGDMCCLWVQRDFCTKHPDLVPVYCPNSCEKAACDDLVSLPSCLDRQPCAAINKNSKRRERICRCDDVREGRTCGLNHGHKDLRGDRCHWGPSEIELFNKLSTSDNPVHLEVAKSFVEGQT